MANWEYCSLDVSCKSEQADPVPTTSSWEQAQSTMVLRRSGEKSVTLEESDVLVALNALGADGWEVASIQEREQANCRSHPAMPNETVRAFSYLLKKQSGDLSNIGIPVRVAGDSPGFPLFVRIC